MRTFSRHFRQRVPVLMVVVVGLGLTACGSSSKTSTTPTTAEQSKAPEVAVTATDYSFNLPASIPGGVVKLNLTNSGKEAHDFQLLKIDGTHTKEEIVAQFGSEGAPIPDWLHAAGGAGTVGPGAPPAVAYVKLAPKTAYWYVCTESTDDNKPHSGLGMIGTFTTGDTSPVADLPKTTATVKAKEYGFDIQGIKAGEQLVNFTDSGPAQLHHFVAFPIQPGKTLDDVKAALAQGPGSGPPDASAPSSSAPATTAPSGPSPIDFQKAVGVSALDPGLSEVAQVRFEPGSYAFVCFLEDRAGGPPHFTKGMITEYKVS